MTICQALLQDYDAEMKLTRTLLERIPVSGYKPHEKSMSIRDLASHVAGIPGWFPMALEAESLHLDEDFVMETPEDRAGLLALFDKNAAIGRRSIDQVSDAEMAKNWTFTYGTTFKMVEPRPAVVRGFLNHLIHHRAQLTVYLRLLNEPVPGLYGPSADEAAA